MATARKTPAKPAPKPAEAPEPEPVAEEIPTDPEPAQEPAEAPEPSFIPDLPPGEVDDPAHDGVDAPPPPKYSPLALALRRRIEQGDHGPIVTQIQQALTDRGFDVKATSMFGIQTAKAVRQFQASVGIRPTGEVNRTTWEALMGVDDASSVEEGASA
jgi:hypothetical protein